MDEGEQEEVKYAMGGSGASSSGTNTVNRRWRLMHKDPRLKHSSPSLWRDLTIPILMGPGRYAPITPKSGGGGIYGAVDGEGTSSYWPSHPRVKHGISIKVRAFVTGGGSISCNSR